MTSVPLAGDDVATIDSISGTPLLVVMTGSRLYGTHRPDSDIDVRFVFGAPDTSLLGCLPYNDSYTSDGANSLGYDIAGWELRKFMGLALKGSFTALELLFAPEENVIFMSDAGLHLRDNRTLFLTEQVRRGLLGFVHGQIKLGTFKSYRHARRVLWILHRMYLTGFLDFRLPQPSLFVSGTRILWEAADGDPRVWDTLSHLAARIEEMPARFPSAPDAQAINKVTMHARTLLNQFWHTGTI